MILTKTNGWKSTLVGPTCIKWIATVPRCFLRTDTHKIWITTDVKRKIPTNGKKRKTVIISKTEENARLPKDVLNCSLLTDCDVTMTRCLICQESWTTGFILPSGTLSQVKRTVLRCKLWALTKTIMVTIWDKVAQWL